MAILHRVAPYYILITFHSKGVEGKLALDLEIMRPAAKGFSITDIATQLHISADEASCRFAAACRQVKAQGQTDLAMHVVDHCLPPKEREQWVAAAKSAAIDLPTLSDVEQRDLLVCLVAPQLRDMPLADVAHAIARSEEEVRTILRQWAVHMGTPTTRTAVAITHYLSQQERLHAAELEVIRLIAEGYTTKEIARETQSPPRPVIKLRRQAYACLELHEPLELAMYYVLYALPELKRQHLLRAARTNMLTLMTAPKAPDWLKVLDIASHPLHWGKPAAVLAPLVGTTPPAFEQCLNRSRRYEALPIRNSVELLCQYFLVRQSFRGDAAE